jgi:putative ABC transport system permease protein
LVRRTTSLVAAGGLAVVAFLLSGAFMAARGVEKTVDRSGDENVALVFRKGSDSEISSGIDEPDVATIVADAQMPGKSPAVSAAELLGVVLLDKFGTDAASNVQVRGTTPGSFSSRRDLQIIAGRAPRPGTDEGIIGSALRGRFAGLDLGQSFPLRENRPIQVVGILSTGGSALESEVWSDLSTAQAAFARKAVVSSVRLRFASAADVGDFKKVLEADRRLGVSAVSEPEYFAAQSEGTSKLLLAVGLLIAVFCSFGAIMAAAITMHGSVDQRRREIGTLRALGFTPKHVLLSIFLEALVLSALGSAAGTLASLALGFVKFSMLNSVSWSEMVFGFQPTLVTAISAFVLAGGIGLLGGLLPAWRAARVNPALALRA